MIRLHAPKRPVVLNSGGPPLELLCVEGDNALVEMLPQWSDDGRGWRWLLPVACFYACVPLVDYLVTNPLPEATEE